MARKVTTVLSLRDNYTAVIKKARRYTSAFDKDVQKMTARLDKASAKKHDIKVKNSAAMKALTALEKKVAPMRNVMVKVAANIQHFKNQIKPVTDTLKKSFTKAWTITLKVKDGVSAVLTKINTALKKVGKGIAIGAAAVIGAGGYAIKKGMDLEGYNISMSHFVGVNNPKSTPAQVQKQTDEYLGWLRQNANATPFGTEEVIQAGSRAVQIAEGNTNAAQGLVKMAEDMAALTPGKTVMDAMEALADAQMGEMERMKEFGFKGSAEEFKKAGGDLFKMKSPTGKTLLEVFGGGAEKFADTTAGMISTITGEIESQIADVGLQMAIELKPFLQWVRDTVLPDLKKFLFEPAKGTGKTGVQVITDALKSAYYWLRDEIPNAIKFLQETWASFTAALNDPNGAIRKILAVFGVNLPTINTGANTGAGANTTASAGTKTGGAAPLRKPIFPLAMPEVAGHQVTATDAVTGFLALKSGSFLSKLFTGKGLVANGANLVKEGVKAGAAAASNAAVTVAASSPALNTAMVGGTAALSTILPGLPMMTQWMNDQANLASWDYYEKTGGKDFSKAPWGDKAAVWWNRALPGLNGWTPPGMVEGLNGLQDGSYTKRAIEGAKLVFTQPEVASQNFKTNIGLLFDSIFGVKAPVNQATTALDALTPAAQNAATNIGTLNTALSGLSSVHTSDNGTEKGGGGKGFAAGIKRVPWDNYPALLHKGETVLPSGEAGEYRGNGNRAGRAANNISLNITVNGANMDENRLVSILVNKLQEVALNMA